MKTSRLNEWQRPRFRGIGEVKVQDDFRGMSELGGQKPRGLFIHTFIASPFNQVECFAFASFIYARVRISEISYPELELMMIGGLGIWIWLGNWFGVEDSSMEMWKTG